MVCLDVSRLETELQKAPSLPLCQTWSKLELRLLGRAWEPLLYFPRPTLDQFLLMLCLPAAANAVLADKDAATQFK